MTQWLDWGGAWLWTSSLTLLIEHAGLVCRINGLTHINLTKLDVLSELETIRLGVGYKLNGKAISGVPSEIADVEKVEVVYEDIPGWQTDISKVRPQRLNRDRCHMKSHDVFLLNWDTCIGVVPAQCDCDARSVSCPAVRPLCICQKSVREQVRTWDDLPENARKYIARIQELIGVKLEWIGVGPGRDAIVVQP